MALSPINYQSVKPYNVVPEAFSGDRIIEDLRVGDEKRKAAAFQQWVQKGVDGMLQVYSEIPDEVKPNIVDPTMFTAYTGSQEAPKMHMDWYASVNAALNKHNQLTAARTGDYDSFLDFKAQRPDATSADIEDVYGRKKWGEFMAGYQPTVDEEYTEKVLKPGSIDELIQAKESSGVLNKLHGRGEFKKSLNDFETLISRLKRGHLALGRYGIVPQFWFKKAGLTLPGEDEFAKLEALLARDGRDEFEETIYEKDFDKLPEDYKAAFPKAYVDFLNSEDSQKTAFGEVLKDYVGQASVSGTFDPRVFAMLYSTGGTNPDAITHTNKKTKKVTTAKDYADDFEERWNKAQLDPNFSMFEVTDGERKTRSRPKTQAERASEVYSYDPSESFLKIGERWLKTMPKDKAENSSLEKAKIASDKAKADRDERIKRREMEAASKWMKEAAPSVETVNSLDKIIDEIEVNGPPTGYGLLTKPFRDYILMTNEEFESIAGNDEEAKRLAGIRLLVQSAFNSHLHRYAGTAVAKHELENIEKEFGLGTLSTYNQFEEGIKILRDKNLEKIELANQAYGDYMKKVLFDPKKKRRSKPVAGSATREIESGAADSSKSSLAKEFVEALKGIRGSEKKE